MKTESLGYNTKTGQHNRQLTHFENVFVGILWLEHVGRDCKISADALAVDFAERLTCVDISQNDKSLAKWKRAVRRIQNHLLLEHDHIPILSKAGNAGGYWIAETEAEAHEFYDTFRKRGITGIVKASRGRYAAMVDVMQQMSFEFEDLLDKSGIQVPDKAPADSNVPVAVVDSFLSKMLEDPGKYASGLKKIGDKYGSVLMDRKALEAMKAKAAELNNLVESIAC